MNLPEPVSPSEAEAVWNSIRNPSARRVAKALTQAGRRIHHSTISRWRAEGWRPVPDRPHPLDAAKWALDVAAPVLTGEAASGVEALPERQEQAEKPDGRRVDQAGSAGDSADFRSRDDRVLVVAANARVGAGAVDDHHRVRRRR